MRNRQTDLRGRLEVYHQLKLRRLLNRLVSELAAFEDLVEVKSAVLPFFAG
jgi:hypothetical protein